MTKGLFQLKTKKEVKMNTLVNHHECDLNHNDSNTLVPGSSVNEIPISEPSGREDSNS